MIREILRYNIKSSILLSINLSTENNNILKEGICQRYIDRMHVKVIR